jgi:diguanylate cyclase (GGDEF)-like protein/PAS domain S-box-containing protein
MKPLRTFRIRFWLPLGIMVIFTISILISAFKQRDLIEGEMEAKAWSKVQQQLGSTAMRAEVLLAQGNRELVGDEISDYGTSLNVLNAVLVDDQGRVLEATRRDWIGQQAQTAIEHFDAARFHSVQESRQQVLEFVDDRHRIEGYQPVVLPSLPDEVRSSRVGVLLMDYDLSRDKADIWQELLKQRFTFWCVILFMVLALVWLISSRISKPLKALTDAVQRFGQGERDVAVYIVGAGELAELGSAWNQMHDRLMSTLDQLAQSNENLEVTLFSIGDAVIATDAAGRVTQMNGVAQHLTAWAMPDALGRPLGDVFHIVNAHTRALADDPVRRVLDTGEIVGLANHTVLIARDGLEYQIADSAAPIHDRKGTVIGVVLVFRDVTEEYALREELVKNELMLRTIVETEPACVKVLGLDGALQQMNRAGLDMIEADSLEQVAGCQVVDIVSPPYQAAFRQLSGRVFLGETGSLEFEIIGLKGRKRWLETRAVPMRDAEGRIVGLLGLTHDITERKAAERELKIAATAFETQEGIMVTDVESRILRINKAFTRITGYTEQDAMGKNPSFLKSGRHDPAFYQAMWQSLERERYWQGEIWNRRKTGEVFPEWLTITGITDGAGNIVNYVASFSDISQFKEAEERIHLLAFYDPLTGLPNRRLLYDRLHQAYASSGRSNAYGAILFIDLDNFKVINDTRGHEVGDKLLIEVAKRLNECVRSEDTVARLGGDEFVVMLDSLSEDSVQAQQQVEAVGHKILHVFSSSFVIDGYAHHTSPSIGVSLFRDHDVKVDELLKRADTAMYQAKQSGRNTLRFYDPEMQQALEARLVLEAEMRASLMAGDFRVYYQPQVNHQGRIMGAEALLRWQHPVRGLVGPADFIPLAEETGLIAPLGEWVLAEACKQLKLWEKDPETQHLQLSVNVSARQFRQGTFVDQVQIALFMGNADPKRLKLELTESLVLEDVEGTIEKMKKLKQMGVSFSMDDFGTGQSSLTYLKKLPLDQLKIDKSFVQDITKDPDDAVIVQTITAMAINLGLDVIAEGVETQEQRTFLEHCGCLVYQGYLFSKPVPVEAFNAMLQGA